jgi:uncharacterized protein involved in copper resistance
MDLPGPSGDTGEPATSRSADAIDHATPGADHHTAGATHDDDHVHLDVDHHDEHHVAAVSTGAGVDGVPRSSPAAIRRRLVSSTHPGV